MGTSEYSRTVKSRKEGEAVTITIPKKINAEPGVEYYVLKGENGAFTCIPKEENVFKKSAREGRKINMDDEWMDDSPVGRELLWGYCLVNSNPTSVREITEHWTDVIVSGDE